MDVFLQTGHQSQCCRLARYHNDRDSAVFPAEGFGTEAIEEELLEVLKKVDPPAGAVRLQCNPRNLEQFLQDSLPPNWALDPRAFVSVLSVVQVDGRLHWHLHPSESLYRNSPTHQRVDSASSAIHKLEEGLLVAGISLDDLDIAIDLGEPQKSKAISQLAIALHPRGAAPGGWTMLLARKVQRVFAVDNAILSEEALLPNVVHIRSLAHTAEPHILRHSGGRLADILVSDMNLHISEAIKPIKSLLPLVKSGGVVIVTLKFFGVGREPRKWESKVVEDLRNYGIGDCRVLWCLANTVHERMLIAWKQ